MKNEADDNDSSEVFFSV